MRVVATVPEWTLSFSLVKQPTRNFFKNFFVFLDKIVFLRPTLYQVV
jgi:hypothetical protein